MFIYQPTINSNDRVAWYGGESTQLHYETQGADGEWKDVDVCTLGSMPDGMSEMHAEIVEYYNYCQTVDHY